MLPLRKKKPEAAAATAVPAWHPNFRNFERLPDTKVVRTSFFVNGVAVFVAAVMLLWFAYNEYQIRGLHSTIADWQRQIDRDHPASNRAIAQYKTFQTEEARAKEIETFIKSKPLISELLLRIGETLPANIALDGFDFRESTITLRGTVRGAPDQASGYASAYLQLLRADPVISAQFEEIKWGEQGLTRSAQTGRLVLDITLRLKDPSGAAPKKR
jgi:hypothetical protein